MFNTPVHFTDLSGSRALTIREKGFLRRYFGSSLDVGIINVAVAIGRRAYSPYGSHIRLPARYFTGSTPAWEIELSDCGYAAAFVHEAAHVWQRQHGEFVTCKGLFLQLKGLIGINPYHYDTTQADPAGMLAIFQQGNIEQQGQIVQDFVGRDLTGRDTSRFSRVRDYLCTR